MMKHLWALCNKEDILWVKWVHTYIIKDQCLQQMTIPQDVSWTSQKIPQIRYTVQPLIKYVIGNCQSTFLWPDHWHPIGHLFQLYGHREVYNMGRSLNVKVSTIISYGR